MKGGNRRRSGTVNVLRIYIRDDDDVATKKSDLGSKSPSSPSLTPSTFSSPSPTSTTFPPTINGTTRPHTTTSLTAPSVISSISLDSPTKSKTIFPSSATPATSSTHSAISHAVITVSVVTVTPTSLVRQVTLVQPIPGTDLSSSATRGRQLETSTATSYLSSAPTGSTQNANGGDGASFNDNNPSRSPTSNIGTGIALGTVAGVAFLLSILFMSCKWRRRRAKARRRSDLMHVAFGGPDERSYKTESRVVYNFASAPYSLPNGDDRYLYPQEKQRGYETTSTSIREPQPTAQRAVDRSISTWLQHHEPQMLNPMVARASSISSETGWRSNGPSMISRAERNADHGDIRSFEVPSSIGTNATPPLGFFVPRSNTQIRTDLGIPPPKAPTVAATEITSRSSGTWNTWGVMQHREENKDLNGWKTRLGL